MRDFLLTGITALFCILTQKAPAQTTAGDRRHLDFVKRHVPQIRELAAYAIGFASGKGDYFMRTDTISDLRIRRKFKHNGLSGYVSVYFKQHFDPELDAHPDSVVVLQQTSLYGRTEIQYDFAIQERSWPENKMHEFLFLRAASRIYFRRKPLPFPMM